MKKFDFEKGDIDLDITFAIKVGKKLRGKVGPDYDNVKDCYLYDFSCDGNNLLNISCKIDKSSNSNSTKNSDNENINSNEFQNENYEGDIIFKETPHFFPQIANKEKILSDKIKIQNNLIQPMDGIKVNKELKNLFDNIPENLKSDPEVNEKVGILLKNIYEMKQIIKDKKDKKNKPMTERKKKNNLITYTPTSSKKIVYQKTNVNSRYIKQ